MKKMTIVLAALLLLTGCGKSEPASTVPEETTTTEATSETSTESSTEETTTTAASTSAETTATTAAETEKTKKTAKTEAAATTAAPEAEAQSNADVYMQILDTLWNEGTFPDGTEADIMGEMTDNRFAVFDIDGDGRDELLLDYESASMAGMVFFIWDADSNGNPYEELHAFPAVTFYDNGMLTVGVSHNQGFAGEFWPYTLLEYDAANDTYQSVASVDAMDRAYMEELGVLDEYPEEADTSASGFVYYIGNDTPIDKTEYDAWYDSMLGGASEVTIPWQEFSPENFVSLR